MSGRYASYWNAFLLFRNLLNAILWCYLHKKLKISKSASEKKPVTLTDPKALFTVNAVTTLQ